MTLRAAPPCKGNPCSVLNTETFCPEFVTGQDSGDGEGVDDCSSLLLPGMALSLWLGPFTEL